MFWRLAFNDLTAIMISVYVSYLASKSTSISQDTLSGIGLGDQRARIFEQVILLSK